MESIEGPREGGLSSQINFFLRDFHRHIVTPRFEQYSEHRYSIFVLNQVRLTNGNVI